MQHCCKFRADEIYYLSDTILSSSRKLSIGFCPICQKPVIELMETSFDGQLKKLILSGIKADNFVMKHKDEILYSVNDVNYRKLKNKPFGWKYGKNKSVKIKGENKIQQIAADFYGNEEVIRIVKERINKTEEEQSNITILNNNNI